MRIKVYTRVNGKVRVLHGERHIGDFDRVRTESGATCDLRRSGIAVIECMNYTVESAMGPLVMRCYGCRYER